MLILTIDSTMNGCSAGLHNEEKGTITETTLEMTRGQAEHLMPMIDDVIKTSGHAYADIDLIAVTNGPGAFTGMRIGLSTAKALALALNIPAQGICTFQAILETYRNTDGHQEYPYYGVLLETKRQDYYFQMFDGQTLSPCSEKTATTAENIVSIIGDRKIMIIGDAAQRFRNDTPAAKQISFHNIFLPKPPSIALCARREYKKQSDIPQCNPVYLRSPDVGIPKNRPKK